MVVASTVVPMQFEPLFSQIPGRCRVSTNLNLIGPSAPLP